MYSNKYLTALRKEVGLFVVRALLCSHNGQKTSAQFVVFATLLSILKWWEWNQFTVLIECVNVSGYETGAGKGSKLSRVNFAILVYF